MTPAQKNARKAMQLYHSGEASSLKEAWRMVRGSKSNPRKPARRNKMMMYSLDFEGDGEDFDEYGEDAEVIEFKASSDKEALAKASQYSDVYSITNETTGKVYIWNEMGKNPRKAKRRSNTMRKRKNTSGRSKMIYTLEILDIDAYDDFETDWEGLDAEAPSTDSSGRWITRTSLVMTGMCASPKRSFPLTIEGQAFFTVSR